MVDGFKMFLPIPSILPNWKLIETDPQQSQVTSSPNMAVPLGLSDGRDNTAIIQTDFLQRLLGPQHLWIACWI